MNNLSRGQFKFESKNSIMTKKGAFKLNIEMGKRIMAIRGNKSQEEFAEIIGTSQSKISRIEQGYVPESNILHKIAEYGKTTVEWILTGRNISSILNNLQELVEVRIFSYAGAGNPLDFSELPPIETLYLPKEIAGNIREGVRVKGNSMWPTYPSGTYVGVDIKDKAIISGEAYCLWIPYEGYVIKRIEMKTDHILIKSDNPIIKPEEKPIDYLERHFLIGRVAWWWYRRRNG